MTDIFTALGPVLFLILFGCVLKQANFLPDEAWRGLEKLTYFILFPSLLIRTLGRQILGDILEIIGRAALPFGLMAVGAALKPRAVHHHLGPIVMATLIQYGLTGPAVGALTIALMTPTAPSSCILARQLGGDVETMSSNITIQTILAFLVMTVIGLLVFS